MVLRVFLAGATGVIGQPLLRRLVAEGHEVVGLTRSIERAPSLAAAGATPLIGDVFDGPSLIEGMKRAAPEVVIHQLTALPPRIDPRRVHRDLAATNRLRTEGTRNLVDAAVAAGARRVVAQSLAFVSRPGEGLAAEDDPLYVDCPNAFRPMVAAVDQLEAVTLGTTGIEGVVLRYGLFYGGGTIYADGGSFHRDVGRRRVPLVGDAGGVYSFVHVEDAAEAALLALSGPEGTFHIVDDCPTAVADWLPDYAAAIGAPQPLWVPSWLARLGAGPYGVFMMTALRGASNARARDQLGWAPGRPCFHGALHLG